MKTAPFLILAGLAATLGGCTTTSSTSQPTAGEPDAGEYLPVGLDHVDFGQPRARFLEAYPDAKRDAGNSLDFRHVYVREDVHPNYQSVVYYFDADGEEPLYEIILNYRDVATRDRWIPSRLGPPNFRKSEWLFPTRGGYKLNVWTFGEKLIFAAILPGTEWDEDGDGEPDTQP